MDMEQIRDQLHRASCIIGLVATAHDDEIELSHVLVAETLRAAESLVLAANEQLVGEIHRPRIEVA